MKPEAEMLTEEPLIEFLGVSLFDRLQAEQEKPTKKFISTGAPALDAFLK